MRKMRAAIRAHGLPPGPIGENQGGSASEYRCHGHLPGVLETLRARRRGDPCAPPTIQDRRQGIEESARARFFGYADICAKMASIRADLGGISFGGDGGACRVERCGRWRWRSADHVDVRMGAVGLPPAAAAPTLKFMARRRIDRRRPCGGASEDA